MAQSIKDRLASVKNVALRRALQPLFEAILADGQRFLTGSATWNVGDLAGGADESKDVTVTGAALGDFCVASLGVDTVDMGVVAAVTAENTATVTVTNLTGGNVNLDSTTVRVLVIPAAAYTAQNLTA